MRVRIRKVPHLSEQRWRIEIKKWWYLQWQIEDACYGDKSKEHALALAHEYANPIIIEVKK